MNPIVLQFANGNVFFVGQIFVIVAAILLSLTIPRWLRGLSNILLLVGVGLALFSGTPIIPGLSRVWVCFCLYGLIILNLRRKAQNNDQRAAMARLLFVSATAISLFSLVLLLIELPHHFTPSIPVSPQRPVYVIGDSITAGIDAREQTWPTMLAKLKGLNITNLARPGATASSAFLQTHNLNATNALIFIEIGGNDIFSQTPVTEFAWELDCLLRELRRGNNQLVMFEIPLPPSYQRYGGVQRALARRYHAILLPKFFLTRVFGLEDATLDGLHLSQKGHDAFAKEISEVMK